MIGVIAAKGRLRTLEPVKEFPDAEAGVPPVP
jgi:hypothetical protein